jgi:cyanobactin maturation PatA/PatG family protease
VKLTMISAAANESDLTSAPACNSGPSGRGAAAHENNPDIARPDLPLELKLDSAERVDRLTQSEPSGEPLAGGLQGLLSALAHAAPGERSVKIGIIDGLPDLTHPALKNAEIEILDIMVPDGCRIPDAHATGICSVIFGSGDNFRGFAPGCTGVVLPIFFGPHDAARFASQLDLARAITFGLERGASIINVSAGQKVVAPDAHEVLAQALDRCAEQRVLVVAAAGNDGCACLHVPAAIPSVLAVGAIDGSGDPLQTSNWGTPYRQNGILAPGDSLTVATLAGGICTASGTSYATAVVSGTAALLLSLARREGYRVDAIDVQQILIESAAPCTLQGDGACDRFLAGTLDATAAMAALRRLGNVRQSRVPMKPQDAIRQNDSPIHFQQIVMRRENTMSDATLIPRDATASAGGATPLADPTPPDAKLLQSEAQPALSSAPTTALAVSSSSPSSQLGLQPLDRLSQQSCGCGCGQSTQLVYALGALWFDFGSEARRDAFVQQMAARVETLTDTQVIEFLESHPEQALGLTFVLRHGDTPIYAIQPAGPFADKTYATMFAALTSSLDEDGSEQRISIPGFITGSTRLWNGMTVPVVTPDLRGIYTWRSATLIEAVRQVQTDGQQAPVQELKDFLDKVYYELRNLGVAPRDRALNYAATNAYQAAHALADAAARSLVLDSIDVVKSPICRPDSDCWDVQLVMFDDDDLRKPNRVYRFTVDVSEVIPVTIGRMRNWPMRPS